MSHSESSWYDCKNEDPIIKIKDNALDSQTKK